MARPRTNVDWSHGETIDLTLSSPEPEPQPQSQPHPPVYNSQSYSYREPGHHSTSRVKHEPGQASGTIRTPFVPRRSRPIHLEHLKQIISTTDRHHLQNVLLDLCKISPAFSGALVRGLSPHSAFAQRMINQHRANTHAFGNHGFGNHGFDESDGDEESDDEEDEQHQRESLRMLLTPTAPASHRAEAPLQTRNDDLPRPPQSVSRIKREPISQIKKENNRFNCYRYTSPSEQHPQGTFQETFVHPRDIRSPLKNPSRHVDSKDGPSDRTSRHAQSMHAPPQVKKAPGSKVKTCINCNEPFTGVAVCIYHRGKEIQQPDGSTTWDCCFDDSLGCQFAGEHTAMEDLEEYTSSHRRRLSSSPGAEDNEQGLGMGGLSPPSPWAIITRD
ncbi:hypothetical protein GMOD_00007987 [Pyrenophora seminiperda CCB06]|uniref:Uncharacterized protein n=1 Tax=Pyrenophora seminiperda CCB06 TaxID=1302712 RepID=A0A3M7MGA6_9PLEO|nr:hypothetical protein GMOD_00007987 [Pyrenophora seminiperda CCB06]